MSDQGGLGPADKLSIVALVISLVAAGLVCVQLFQTVLSGAQGLPSRDEKVMGLWATQVNLKSQGIRYLWLRAEVDFKSPIIFLAPNGNKKGPLSTPKNPIYYAHGTPKSFKEYFIDESDLERRESEESTATVRNIPQDRERVTTVANERVTWLTLLAAIQRMERDSNRWELRQRGTDIRPQIDEDAILKVGIQIKSRSFDANPAVKKPYATTTICHMVELAAVLGLYWKEFDRDRDRYRAEGNGYFLLGTRLSNFGIAFTFERTGWVEFDRRRLIQAEEIKQYCFGNVPILYRNRGSDQERPSELSAQVELQTLHLGSWDEIAETLRLIGCNTNTRLYYLDEGYQHRHLFPVVGMLARTLQIKGRCFTYLPNPTIFALDKKSFSLDRLRSSFNERIHALITQQPEFNTPSLKEIIKQSDTIKSELAGREFDFIPKQLDLLHTALHETDKILGKDNVMESTVPNSNHGSLSIDGNKKSVVLDVLRRHIQEVHLAINTSVEETINSTEAVTYGRKRLESTQHDDVAEVIRQHLSELVSVIEKLHSSSRGSNKDIPFKKASAQARRVSAVGGDISFQDLLILPPEDKERELMDKYFNLLRPRVIVMESEKHPDQAALAASRVIHEQNPLPNKGENEQLEGNTTTTTGIKATSDTDAPTEQKLAAQDLRDPLLAASGSSDSTNKIHKAPTKDEIERNDIWCTLVFRMICWLTLHDFAKEDIQLPESSLMGNRLPVYIM